MKDIWLPLTQSKAKELCEQYSSFGIVCDYTDSRVRSIYEDLKKEHDAILNMLDSDKLGYNYDLEFGLALYRILNTNGFTLRHASNDAIWRFIAVKVIPDIVNERWKTEDGILNNDRFWKVKRRIYPKTLWWYIHLSWMGNEQDTLTMLSKNQNTDTIMNLIERSGKAGYRINLYREIMRQYSDCGTRDVFRKIMKLNTVKLKVIEPELMENGIQGYVTSLFNEIQGEQS